MSRNCAAVWPQPQTARDRSAAAARAPRAARSGWRAKRVALTRARRYWRAKRTAPTPGAKRLASETGPRPGGREAARKRNRRCRQRRQAAAGGPRPGGERIGPARERDRRSLRGRGTPGELRRSAHNRRRVSSRRAWTRSTTRSTRHSRRSICSPQQIQGWTGWIASLRASDEQLRIRMSEATRELEAMTVGREDPRYQALDQDLAALTRQIEQDGLEQLAGIQRQLDQGLEALANLPGAALAAYRRPGPACARAPTGLPLAPENPKQAPSRSTPPCRAWPREDTPSTAGLAN